MKLAPSILAADFARLGAQVAEAGEAGADRLHIDVMVAKITRVRRLIDRVKPECDLEVDGGIDAETAQLCIEAGANVLVAGSEVFANSEGVTQAMSRLRARRE